MGSGDRDSHIRVFHPLAHEQGPRRITVKKWPNEITGADAGGPCGLEIREPWAARAAQFCRYAGQPT